MGQRNDQVFGVSLAEIAFILVFILMLLLGFMLLQERAQREESQVKLERQGKALDAAAATKAMNVARDQLEQAAQRGGIPDPQTFADRLVAAGKRDAENARLHQELLDMTKRMEALDAMRQSIEAIAKESGKAPQDLIRERVEAALEITAAIDRITSADAVVTSRSQDGKRATDSLPIRRDARSDLAQIRNALRTTSELREKAKSELALDIQSGEEANVIRDLIANARAQASKADSPGKLQAENTKLQQQVNYYRSRMRGLDHPPCWITPEGGTEFIFKVHTTAAGVVVTEGWPTHREADALASPGFDSVRPHFGEPVSLARFRVIAQPFLDFGKRQTPECRHFVYLSSSIDNADERDRHRRTVEEFFYKQERVNR